MLIILPPSETKRDGGAQGSTLDLAAVSFPALTSARVATLSALNSLSQDAAIASAALGLGPTQAFEIDRNRVVESSPTMQAIDRYTGVLYDGVDAATLDAAQHAWLGFHVLVHSALFGLLRASDPIPAYRLSHDSRLPGLPLKKHWRAEAAAVLAGHDGLILDLRSEAYVAMGPRPEREGAYYLRVVTQTATGQKRALNHFNKKGKGEFVRALAVAQAEFCDGAELLAWAEGAGIRLAHGAPGELELTI